MLLLHTIWPFGVPVKLPGEVVSCALVILYRLTIAKLLGDMVVKLCDNMQL